MPTVTIGDNSTDDFSGTEYSMLYLSTPTTNYSSDTTFEVTKYDPLGHASTAIKFPGLSNIVGPVAVSAATLYLYQTSDFGPDPYFISAYRILRNWVNTQATWNIWSTGNNWTTAGALSNGNDRFSPAASNIEVDIAEGYYAWTGLASVIQQFINGSLPNYGFLMERTDAGDDENYKFFGSQTIADGARPYLEVTYEVALFSGGSSKITRGINTGIKIGMNP